MCLGVSGSDGPFKVATSTNRDSKETDIIGLLYIAKSIFEMRIKLMQIK